MRSLRAMAAMSMLLASAVPAAADWQYTQWGMDPAQVIAASGGAAHDNGDRSLDAPGLTAGLVAAYQGVAQPFTAVFLFDTEHRLRYVTLNPVGATTCRAMMETLTGHYGPPRGGAGADLATTMRWDDVDGDNLVVYANLGGDDCTIQYSRLPPTRPSGKGL